MFKPCQDCSKQTNSLADCDVEIVMEVHKRTYKYLVHRNIVHYMLEHGYLPCPDFMDVVLHGELVAAIKVRTNGIETSEIYLPWYASKGFSAVGYLNGEYERGEAPGRLVNQLNKMMSEAEIGDEEV